ncbi:hypothetical protein GX51_07800, partial [Blastomyces parvus]
MNTIITEKSDKFNNEFKDSVSEILKNMNDSSQCDENNSVSEEICMKLKIMRLQYEVERMK